MSEQFSLLEVLDENALNDVAYHLDALIRTGKDFTAESIRSCLSPYAVTTLAKHTGTLGNVIRQAYKAKRIEKVGYTPSTHEGANSRVLCVWRGVS